MNLADLGYQKGVNNQGVPITLSRTITDLDASDTIRPELLNEAAELPNS